MVTVEALEALDLLIWLGNGIQAAQLAHCNQSTVSRRMRLARDGFRLKMRRINGTWQQQRVPLLLALERQVHQHSRFTGRKPLRLQAPFWSSEALLNELPKAWVRNPLTPVGSAHHCLDLLEQRLVDACVATLPERPAGDDPRFAVFDLFHSPIHLVTTRTSAMCRVSRPSREEIGSCCQIATFPFNPRPQKRFIHAFYDHHFPAGLAAEREPVCFANSLMLRILGERMLVQILDVAVPSYYVESLVVLEEHRNSPAIAALLDHLRRRILELSRSEASLAAVL